MAKIYPHQFMLESQKKFNFLDTTATRKVFGLKKRICAVAGGTSASKTISILVWLIDYCQSHRGNEVCTVVSESYPHLEGGSIRDFENIMKDRNYWRDDLWVKSKGQQEYTFETGNKIEFRTFDTVGKAHGPRRDILFLNEANNLPYSIVDQLITRTRKRIWMDWNPSEEFWFYTEMRPNRDDIDFITLTYLDNEALDENTIREIESHRSNKRWWTVYGLGQLGQKEENIYKNWLIIDEIPHEAKLVRRGLDFGYSNDPTALLDIHKFNGGYIWDEQIFQKGLANKDIADYVKNLDDSKILIIADSAEPKSIDELRSYGLNVLPCKKGKDSVNHGIQLIQNQKISITRRSINLIKEYRNYQWEKDKNGKVLNVPRDIFNHGMDGGRYAMESLIGDDEDKEIYVQPAYQPSEYEGSSMNTGATLISTPTGGRVNLNQAYQQAPIELSDL